MSKSAGIVAEYNPFHTGHRYQLDFLRKNGVENIAVAMSGSCVQRGELAFMDKFSRAEMALLNGASLVAEIPCPFSIRSAEGFATAGVQTLKALGVERISFGSESAELNLLWDIARYLLTDEYENRLKEYLAENHPFAVAREKTIFDKFDISKNVVSASNDILAIEYLKACIKINWKPEIIPVKRIGAGYNSKTEKDSFASAGGIRDMLSQYRNDRALKFIPAESKDLFIKNMDRGNYFLTDSAFEKAVLFSLQNKTAEDFIKIPDCNFELANSFEKAVASAYSFDSLFEGLPTKRYTKARLNRIILSAFMDIDNTIPRDIQYVRILGFDKNKEDFFRQRSKKCDLPISHSAKILSNINENCNKITQIENRATDAQSIFCKIGDRPRKDFTSKIIKI